MIDYPNPEPPRLTRRRVKALLALSAAITFLVYLGLLIALLFPIMAEIARLSGPR